MDMLGQTPIPSSAVDECFADGFALNSGVRITNGAGVLLVGGEAFEWRPWVVAGEKGGAGEVEKKGEGEGDAVMGEKRQRQEVRRKLVNAKGQWALEREEQWGFLGRLWPRCGMSFRLCLCLFYFPSYPYHIYHLFLHSFFPSLFTSSMVPIYHISHLHSLTTPPMTTTPKLIKETELTKTKTDLLILGLGPTLRPLSPATRTLLNNMGIRVEVLDTRNAASQYNLLATERGVEQVAAALVPVGWRE